MKRVAYSFLLIFLVVQLTGCSSCKSMNYAHVEFKDSTSGNFLLQSVADSSLRLLDFLNDSMHVIGFQQIRKFYLHGDTIDIYSPEGIARLHKSLEPNKNIWME